MGGSRGTMINPERSWVKEGLLLPNSAGIGCRAAPPETG